MKKYTAFNNILYVVKLVFKTNKWVIVMIVLLALFSSSLQLFNVFFLKFILDMMERENKFNDIVFYLVAILLMLIAIHIINSVISNVINPIVSEKMHTKFNLMLYKRISKFLLIEIEDAKFYEEYFYVLQNMEQSVSGIMRNIGYIITAVFSAAGLMAYLLYIDKWIMTLTVTGVLLNLIFSMKGEKIQHEYGVDKNAVSRKEEYVERVFYLPDYTKELRCFPLMTLFYDNYYDCYARKRKIHMKYGVQAAGLNSTKLCIQSCVYIATMALLIFRVFHHQLLTSDFIVSLNSAQQLNNQLITLIHSFPAFYQHSLVVNKFRSFFEKDGKPEGTISLNGVDTLDLENVSFSYDKSPDKPLLKHINLHFKRGQKIALVGPNGAGKSTLAKIICGLYEADEGAVRLNGLNIPDIANISLHSRVGMVFQDYRIFASTVAENVLMKKVSCVTDENKVANALRFVGLLDKVEGLPQGIHTYITREFSNEGTILSGGELQKIALARVYAQDYDVILFDEITSSYDPLAESAIYDLIEQLPKDKIIIFISHRLANMKDMDHIVFLQNGEVTEQGSHRLLLDKKGAYAKMYLAQAENYYV